MANAKAMVVTVARYIFSRTVQIPRFLPGNRDRSNKKLTLSRWLAASSLFRFFSASSRRSFTYAAIVSLQHLGSGHGGKTTEGDERMS